MERVAQSVSLGWPDRGLTDPAQEGNNPKDGNNYDIYTCDNQSCSLVMNISICVEASA